MTTKTLDMPTPKVTAEETRQPLCVEFVKFCKEQYLSSSAAHTFFHVLHNNRWDKECEQIRENMRPEVEALFAPIEKAISEGKECKEIMQKLIVTLTKRS